MKKKAGLAKVNKSKTKNKNREEANDEILESISSSASIVLPKILKSSDGSGESANLENNKKKKTLRFKDSSDENEDDEGANMSTSDEDEEKTAFKKQKQQSQKKLHKKKQLQKKAKEKNDFFNKQIIELKIQHDETHTPLPRLKSSSQMRLLEERAALKSGHEINMNKINAFSTTTIMPNYIRDIEVLPQIDAHYVKMTPKEIKIYEIPNGLALTFFELISQAKWQQAKNICATLIRLNPTNQKFQEFFILLNSLTKLKKKMGKLYYKDYTPPKPKGEIYTQKPQQNASNKLGKTAVIINSKIYKNEGETISLGPKSTIKTIEETQKKKSSIEDEYFKEELKILSIKDENLRNFKILGERTTTFNKSIGSVGGVGSGEQIIEKKTSHNIRENSIKTKTSSINFVEDTGEFESILKEFYELK